VTVAARPADEEHAYGHSKAEYFITGWRRLDPLVALAVAANIIWTGIGIVRRSILGLMDTALPSSERILIQNVLNTYTPFPHRDHRIGQTWPIAHEGCCAQPDQGRPDHRCSQRRLEPVSPKGEPERPPLVALGTDDDGMLLWFNDRSVTATEYARKFLLSYDDSTASVDGKPVTSAGLSQVLAGSAAAAFIGVEVSDPRVPDVIGIAPYGVVYTSHKSKIAEHGGDHREDRNVPILLTWPGARGGRVDAEQVETTQIAPTILHLLGLNPASWRRFASRVHGLCLTKREISKGLQIIPSQIAFFSCASGKSASRVVSAHASKFAFNVSSFL
jgi:hypothetical protein